MKSQVYSIEIPKRYNIEIAMKQRSEPSAGTGDSRILWSLTSLTVSSNACGDRLGFPHFYYTISLIICQHFGNFYGKHTLFSPCDGLLLRYLTFVKKCSIILGGYFVSQRKAINGGGCSFFPEGESCSFRVLQGRGGAYELSFAPL